MTLPFTIPDWIPWWVPIAVLVPLLFYALVFLFMPFSVIGVKGRLEAVEARLDEIQGEIRSLAFRLPEPIRGAAYEDPPPVMSRAAQRREPPVVTRPPIPPAPQYPDSGEDPEAAYRPLRAARAAGRRDEPGPPRAEPRLDWPR